jgi:hypothetical protein
VDAARLFADTSDAVLNRILEEIDKGMENGRRYTNANNATDRAAWQVVARHLERDKRQARAVVRTWIDNGVLVVEDYDDPVEHKTLKGLRLDPTKRPGPQ